MDTTPRSDGPVKLASSAWSFFKVHGKLLVSISVIPAIIVYAGNTFAVPGNGILQPIGALLAVAGSILAIAAQGAIIDAIRRISTGGEALPLFEQFKMGFTYFGPLMLIVLLQMFILGGSAVLLVIPAIIVSVYTGLTAFVRIIDGKKGLTAFVESYTLVKGRWWGVLGRDLFLGLIVLIGMIVLALADRGLDAIFGLAVNGPAATVISSILNLLFTSVLVGPLSTIYIYNLYSSLKATRQPNVSETVFRRFLTGFLVLGVIGAVSLPIVGLMLILSTPMH